MIQLEKNLFSFEFESQKNKQMKNIIFFTKTIGQSHRNHALDSETVILSRCVSFFLNSIFH